MKILEYTFQHLPGFGNIKEKELWKRHIYTWEDFEKTFQKQLNFDFYDSRSILEESRHKLLNKDIVYFADRLPTNLHFLIPHSFPEETIFLDIETTGLSIYYDKLTVLGWSILDQYNVYIEGHSSKDEFLDALTKAKCVVTFNGSLYDLPFLKNAFNEIKIPKCHIDLRFFSKRVGYRGGQKNIEKLLGVFRPSNVSDISGYEATLLWHKYKEGDKESLKKLIEYNAHDIDGMKCILETITSEFIKLNNLPIQETSVFQFSKWRCNYQFAADISKNGIYIPSYGGPRGPILTMDSFKEVINKKIVGIDLTGSEKRATGWCLLEGAHAITKLISTDNDLIAETIRHNPEIISIDSPLSIPIGRTSFFDDDPAREKYGITRECERIMAKRGIKSYPCLIQSMQKLTERGMLLASQFRTLGYTVIESYPGAAQDIIGIPRKGKSLEYLVKGLKDFGVIGAFDHPNVSHDEIDAITSAIVGYFYLANKYEALGNDDEGYLIVPKIN